MPSFFVGEEVCVSRVDERLEESMEKSGNYTNLNEGLKGTPNVKVSVPIIKG